MSVQRTGPSTKQPTARPAGSGGTGDFGGPVERSRELPRGAGSAAAVLRAVLDHGPVARTFIGAATGLSPAAVSRQTADLISLGLLRELPAAACAPRAGRPSVPIDVDTDTHLACGVHIAVPMVTFGLVDLRGRTVAREQVPHGGDAQATLALVVRHLPGFLRRHAARRRVLGLGVVTGGHVDTRTGTVVEHEPLGWRNLPLGPLLAARTGLPVSVDSHARALAGAEILFGEPRARSSLIHLFVGHVVDAAIATDGVVHRGGHSAAGRVAHLRIRGEDRLCACGDTGCAQAVLSDGALLATAVEQGVLPRRDPELLRDAVAAGEHRVIELVRRRLRGVAKVAATLLDMFDPEVLVLTELGSIYQPQLLPDLFEEIAASSRTCTDPERVVRPNSFGQDVLAVAAAATVLESVHRSPRALRPVNLGGWTNPGNSVKPTGRADAASRVSPGRGASPASGAPQRNNGPNPARDRRSSVAVAK
ncbi:transcriptional regulator/sugar kinase [Frankia sp. EI5c]|uniref:ROK family transcriptional regulator n=1 Tax=Frankia sp. EI5c TaxID=683316 RepID=UPI0007C34F5D|nr:ROK family transcriptional regulator [Frankia sp. EI5c]OAA25225.1 transcriptional regulator/sugar kinase [Frankia sp. EI5c]